MNSPILMNVRTRNRSAHQPDPAAVGRAYQDASIGEAEENNPISHTPGGGVQLLAQRIAKLPDIQRKILAMYYFENIRPAEIAAAFDLPESEVRQIHVQTMLTLRASSHSTDNR